MPSPEELEEKIREQRAIEANKKGLVGQTGKIGTVLRVFGSPIVAQSEGGTYVDTTYFDFWKEEIEEPTNNSELLKSIPIMDSASNSRPEGNEWEEMPDSTSYSVQQIGWHFDGLSRGMHMEIKYDDNSSELSLTYKGYVAYRESKGEILSYVPNSEWEKWIFSLYEKAKEKQRKLKEEEFQNQIEETEKNKKDWWRQMISKWGVK